MTDITRKTWKYLHGPEDAVNIAFETGGVPRSFTVISYAAIENAEIDFNSNGIAIIDNDNLCVVLDGHLQDSDQHCKFLDEIAKKDWKSFSAFCRKHDRSRPLARDMSKERPDQGVLTNQIMRKVTLTGSSDDNRSPEMIAADRSMTCPYSFPARSQAEMVADLMTHGMSRDEQGQFRFSWASEITHEDAVFGGARDAENPDWLTVYAGTPEIFHQIHGEVFEPFFTGDFATWPKTDQGRYGFGATDSPECQSILTLETVEGVDMAFSSRGDLGRLLDSLPVSALREIWKLVRVVDHEMEPTRLEASFSAKLKDFRNAHGASLTQSRTFMAEVTPS